MVEPGVSDAGAVNGSEKHRLTADEYCLMHLHARAIRAEASEKLESGQEVYGLGSLWPSQSCRARSQPSALPIPHRAPSCSRSQPELWGEACVFSVMKNGLYKTRNSQGDGHVGIEPAQSLLIGSCQKQSVYS